MLFAVLSSATLITSALATPFYSSLTASSLFKRTGSGCGTSGPLSCSSTSPPANTCCYESPSGLIQQTQFWDYNPSTGPTDSWTIHGLWPNKCDDTYNQNCDSSRAYTGISELLTAQGASSTLAFMNNCWKNNPNDGSDETLWEHEWSTHGTCYSTLEPSCLPSGSPKGAEAVAFFETAVALFQTLPSYTWLADAGIIPSSSATYKLADIQAALEKGSGGYTAQVDCSSNSLEQISWYFYLRGSVIDGQFVPTNSPQTGSCPSSGIKYPPKTGSSGGCGGATVSIPPTTTSTTSTTTTTTTTTTSRGSSPASASLPAKATLVALTSSGSTTGGLLTLGTWSTQTLATYTLTGTASSFTLKTSKGSCGVSGGAFACGSGVSSTPFSAVISGSNLLLSYGGSTAFSSPGTPGGTAVETVYTGSSKSEVYTIAIQST